MTIKSLSCKETSLEFTVKFTVIPVAVHAAPHVYEPALKGLMGGQCRPT